MKGSTKVEGFELLVIVLGGLFLVSKLSSANSQIGSLNTQVGSLNTQLQSAEDAYLEY